MIMHCASIEIFSIRATRINAVFNNIKYNIYNMRE